MAFNLLQLHIDVFAPAVDYYPSFLTRIAEIVEDFESALRATDTRNIERQYEQNVVRHVERRNRDWIKRVRQIDHNVLKFLAQLMKNSSNVVSLYFFCFVRFSWRGQQGEVVRVGCD